MDIFVGDLKKQGLIEKLQPSHIEGREYLCANGGSLLISKRGEILHQLQKLGTLGNLKIHVLKNYSKRLGINILEVRGRKSLELALNNLLSKGLPSDIVEFKETVVQVVKHCESGVHSQA